MAEEHREALAEAGADGTATFILGGQVGAEPADILLVYPEGNYIRASDERPFLQIGESKYGKFMLELATEAKVDIDTATSIALGLDDEHDPGQPLGRAALRRLRLPQRLLRPHPIPPGERLTRCWRSCEERGSG